jgi:hypothetical protein
MLAAVSIIGLLADFNEASARPTEVLDQEYHGRDQHTHNVDR